jgi:DNA polymerase III delta subunit
MADSENRSIREALLSGDVEEALEELDDLRDDEELILVCDAVVAPTETARRLQDPNRGSTSISL